MRMTAVVAAIALCTVIFTVQSAKADALSPVELAIGSSPTLLENLAQNNEQNKRESANDSQAKAAPKTYTAKEGDTLISIARHHKISWKRLFYKNVELKHPDKLDVGTKLIIPKDNEKLEPRELHLKQPQPRATNRGVNRATSPRTAARSARATPRGSSTGNSYVYGYCTWYVKTRRPDLPNNLGDAYSWVSRAATQGIPTGSTPRAGAVGQSGNHVVYVESVNGDGTVTVSEMNWKGWNIRSTRTTAASRFAYVY